MHACLVPKSRLSLITPWPIASQAPLSMKFSKQEYWSGLPVPSPVDLSNPGMELVSPKLAARFFTSEPPGKSSVIMVVVLICCSGNVEHRDA